MLRYAISDRNLFPGPERARRSALIRQATVLAREGVEHFQVREKDLDDAELIALTAAVRDAVQATGFPMRIVLNGPEAIACRAGVDWHRPSSALQESSCYSTSVHSIADVELHRANAALLLFAPVFGKAIAGQQVQAGVGLQHLREAVQHAHGTPVLALGGVTFDNAAQCMAAGAAGIAGIRLFLR